MLTSGMPMPDGREEFAAINRARKALVAAGVDDIAFTVEIAPSGRTALQLFDHGPAVDTTDNGRKTRRPPSTTRRSERHPNVTEQRDAP